MPVTKSHVFCFISAKIAALIACRISQTIAASEYLLFHAASYISIIRIAKGYHFKKRKGRKTREYAKALENLFLLYLTSYVDSNLGIAEKSLVYKPDF